MIIGLNGFAQVGKDTVGKILIDQYGFERLSFAEPLRKGLYDFNPIVTHRIYYSADILQETDVPDIKTNVESVRLQTIVDSLGWDEAKVKYPEIRELMQRYGTEAGRNIHGIDCWTNIVKKRILAEPEKDFVITDMRFQNEKELVEELHGFPIKVHRKGVSSVNGHISDQPLEGINFNIYNDGSIESLAEGISLMLAELRKISHGKEATLKLIGRCHI